jgi:hypothetical protein
MKDTDPSTALRTGLDRLLKSAVSAVSPEQIEMPFGFDARVVALWRASINANGVTRGLNMLISRVALVAMAVIVVASAGVYRQINQSRDLSEPAANEFAIADSVIQDEFSQ